MAQNKPVKRRKSESANVVPRSKWMKEPSRKRVKETTKMTMIREKCSRRLMRMGCLNGTRAKQHDDEGNSFAKCQPSAASSSVLTSPDGGARRRSRWCFVRPSRTLIPVICSLSQPSQRFRLHPHWCPNTKHQRPC